MVATNGKNAGDAPNRENRVDARNRENGIAAGNREDGINRKEADNDTYGEGSKKAALRDLMLL